MPTHLRAALLLSGLMVAVAGCDSQRPMSAYRHEHAGYSDEESFQKAFELLQQLDEFDPEQTISQIAYNLNRWLAEQPKDAAWIRDPLASDPELGDLLRLPSLANLDRMDITSTDVRYLQEVKWLNDVSQWAIDQPPSFRLAAWLSELPKSLDEASAEKISNAARLFDWTVRNIQIEPLPAQEAAVLTSNSKTSTPPAAQGKLGPGYTRLPWRIMLLGRGDAWQRARIAVLLMRQAGIDAVILATTRTGGEELEPWTVAALVNGQLYLFDPALGIAIPGPDDTGIATFEQLRAQPELLQQLDVSDDMLYPVTASDLGRVEAWIDASSETLSQRMRVIESRLTGEQRLSLTASPTAIKRQLSEQAGISRVALWKIPLEAELFDAARAAIRKRDNRQHALYMREMAMFTGLTPLMQARQLYFRHRFEGDDEKSGAADKYMEARLPDAKIDNLLTDVDTQIELGLRREIGETDSAWQNRLRLHQNLFLEGTIHASYWLGLMHYENGDYQSAINWFLNRTLQRTAQRVWEDGARYNLARSYEALERYGDAREQYLGDDSPQRHGNLVRARWLRKFGAGENEAEAETAPEAEEATEQVPQ